MKAPSFAYIVQLDLPGHPIKIGYSSNLIGRFDAFSGATPVELRLIGATLGGKLREAEFLAATSGRVLKGEWRYATPALTTMLREIYLRGEWFVPHDDLAAIWERHSVPARLAEAKVDLGRQTMRPTRRLLESYRVRDAVCALRHRYPALGLHVSGFDVARHPPCLDWPATEQEAA